MEQMLAQLTPSNIVLFFAYTMVALLAALVARIGVGNMSKKAEAGAIEAVTKAFSGSIDDARQARIELTNTKESHAKLEGRVESLMNQVTHEKTRADSAYEKLSAQTTQIESLKGEVSKLTSDMTAIRERLAKVEAEKKALEAEKNRLENDLSTQGDAYRQLMASIQERIDKAVADVREALRVEYEERITKLEQQIRERDEEIGRLKALLKESESHETENPVPNPADIVGPSSSDATAPGTGSNGNPTVSDSDTGSSDGQSGGGSPSA